MVLLPPGVFTAVAAWRSLANRAWRSDGASSKELGVPSVGSSGGESTLEGELAMRCCGGLDSLRGGTVGGGVSWLRGRTVSM